jgi:hypothetical protein
VWSGANFTIWRARRFGGRDWSSPAAVAGGSGRERTHVNTPADAVGLEASHGHQL